MVHQSLILAYIYSRYYVWTFYWWNDNFTGVYQILVCSWVWMHIFFFKLIKKRFLKTKFNDILNLFLLVRILFRTLSTSIQLIWGSEWNLLHIIDFILARIWGMRLIPIFCVIYLMRALKKSLLRVINYKRGCCSFINI